MFDSVSLGLLSTDTRDFPSLAYRLLCSLGTPEYRIIYSVRVYAGITQTYLLPKFLVDFGLTGIRSHLRPLPVLDIAGTRPWFLAGTRPFCTLWTGCGTRVDLNILVR